MDEFYCTRIVYWDLNTRKDTFPDLSGASEEKATAAVTDFAGKLFADIRDRVVENVLLKCHNFFLVPMQTELWCDVIWEKKKKKKKKKKHVFIIVMIFNIFILFLLLLLFLEGAIFKEK